MDAEIKVPSNEIDSRAIKDSRMEPVRTELCMFRLLARNSIFLVSAFLVHSTSFCPYPLLARNSIFILSAFLVHSTSFCPYPLLARNSIFILSAFLVHSTSFCPNPLLARILIFILSAFLAHSTSFCPNPPSTKKSIRHASWTVNRTFTPGFDQLSFAPIRPSLLT